MNKYLLNFNIYSTHRHQANNIRFIIQQVVIYMDDVTRCVTINYFLCPHLSLIWTEMVGNMEIGVSAFVPLPFVPRNQWLLFIPVRSRIWLIRFHLKRRCLILFICYTFLFSPFNDELLWFAFGMEWKVDINSWQLFTNFKKKTNLRSN